MKIAASNVQMRAKTEKLEYYRKSEFVEVWNGTRASSVKAQTGAQAEAPVQEPAFTPPDFLRKLDERMENYQSYSARGLVRANGNEHSNPDRERAKLLAIQKMIEALTGKRIRFRFLDPEDFDTDAVLRLGDAASAPRFGWGMVVESQEVYSESQTMTYSAEGSIQTADGRSISFSVDLSMSREFSYANSFSLRAGDAALCDPLVINFDAANAGLSDTKFSFDLDADGKTDQISTLLSGSGFLALDKNGDGSINDGSELFGALSGNGFADLAAYDSDSNMWIDENDPIYDKLRIWSTDENGVSRLLALGQKGVGAIYLGNIETAFSFRNSANATNGELRRTGVFLNENGSAGTIQHIDFAL